MTHTEKYGHEKVSRAGKKSDCLICHRVRERERRRQNPEPARTRAREYARAHKVEGKERLRKWKTENRERWLSYFKDREPPPREVARARAHKCYYKNLEKSRAYNRTAQMRRHGSKAAAEYAEVVRRDPCSYCGGQGGQADHIEALSSGGLHDVENLTGACLRCNSQKSDSPLLIFLVRRIAA